MSANAMFLTNVICPLLSGIPLLCFSLYFFYAGEGLILKRARFTPIFFLAFGIFVIGRPIQLLLGPAPWPAIVNGIRAILLIAVCCPLALCQARTLSESDVSPLRLRRPFTVGLSLAAVYMFALIAGSTETKPIFELGSLIAYDCSPAVKKPPLYLREVAQFAQMFAGIGFFGFAGYEMLAARHKSSASASKTDHLLYFAIGCIIFGGSYAVGTLTKQWWLYYLTAIPSAFFMGRGVLEDIKYVRQRVERVTPFLRDELFHSLGDAKHQDSKVQELKELLSKRVSPTLVMIIGYEGDGIVQDAWLRDQESLRQNISEVLDREVGNADYLLLPAGSTRFIICLAGDEGYARNLTTKLQSLLPKGSKVGIGDAHKPQELQHSYLESQTALRTAEQMDQSIVSYIDIGTMSCQRRFPFEARDEFLLEFKHVHHDSARRRLQILLEQMALHAQDDPVVYRMRLVELLGTLINQISEQGNDSRSLLTMTASAFDKLHRLESIKELTEHLKQTVEKLMSCAEPPTVETSTGNPIKRARTFIEEHYAENIKIADVAKRAFVSVSHLQRLFRDTMNITYSSYLATVRIQKAKKLLSTTDSATTEIAFQVGYNDSNYFSTAFRKHEGISPSQYRKQSETD